MGPLERKQRETGQIGAEGGCSHKPRPGQEGPEDWLPKPRREGRGRDCAQLRGGNTWQLGHWVRGSSYSTTNRQAQGRQRSRQMGQPRAGQVCFPTPPLGSAHGERILLHPSIPADSAPVAGPLSTKLGEGLVALQV